MIAQDQANFGTTLPALAAICGVGALLPFMVWIESVGDISPYLSDQVPIGQLPYLLSKLFALMAICFLVIQVYIGTVGRSGPFFRFHRLTGTLTFASILAHALLFTYAVSLREGGWTIAPLLPNFNHGYYKTTISLGIVALAFMVCVIVSGVLRSKFPGLRYLHWLAYPIIALGAWHSMGIGTESRSTFGILMYLMLGALILTAVIARFKRSN